jgi:hypothetical protein
MNQQNNSNSGSIDTILKIGGVLSMVSNFILVMMYLFKGVSLFGSYPNLMLWIGIIVFIVTTTFGIYLLYLTKKNLNLGTHSPFLSRWFVFPFVILFILNCSFTSYQFGHRSSDPPSNDHRIGKTRIVLLLPLNESLKSAYEDGIRQLIGFAEFLKENPECTRHFEFALYDHSMDIKNAERIIKQELAEGTQYFVCTMSSVTLPLSQTFKSLVDSNRSDTTRLPKLICAVTSAPTVNITQGLIYRFYIRSQEEATQLANIGTEKRIATATFIAVDDDYGKGAVREFRSKWKGQPVYEGLYVGKTLSVDEIQSLVAKKIRTLSPAKRQAIFICHYGNGIDNIITALNRERIKATLLATSTISIYDWQKPIKGILDKTEWYTCIPTYTSYRTSQNDVIKNFTTNWRNAKYPDNLDISWDGLDAVIPMRAVYKTEVNQPSTN